MVIFTPNTVIRSTEVNANFAEIVLPVIRINSAAGDYTQTRVNDWTPTTNRINNTDITYTPPINMTAILMLYYSANHGAGAVEFDPAIVYTVNGGAWTLLTTGIGNIAASWNAHHINFTISLNAGSTYVFQGGVSTAVNCTIRNRSMIMMAVKA